MSLWRHFSTTRVISGPSLLLLVPWHCRRRWRCWPLGQCGGEAAVGVGGEAVEQARRILDLSAQQRGAVERCGARHV